MASALTVPTSRAWACSGPGRMHKKATLMSPWRHRRSSRVTRLLPIEADWAHSVWSTGEIGPDHASHYPTRATRREMAAGSSSTHTLAGQRR